MPVIAEALAKRKDVLNESSLVQTRITENGVRYEDETDEEKEDLAPLFARLDELLNEAQGLTVSINKVNNATSFAFEGETLTLMEAIALRERLMSEQRIYASLATTKEDRYSYRGRTKDDLKVIRRFPARDLRKKADAAALRLRRLDMAIQKVNWSTEV